MTRGRRLVAQLLLLVPLVIIDSIDRNAFFFVVGVTLLALPVANWTVAAVLIWTSRQAPDIESLRARADDAVTLALVSTVGAVAGGVALARALGVTFEGRPVVILLAYALILVSVPALDWLKTWRDVWLPRVKRQRITTSEAEETTATGSPAPPPDPDQRVA